MASTSRDSPDPSPVHRFRWLSFFQQSTEPVFVLDRRRRLVFVNRAWEKLTGLALADVRGQTCRRRPRGILTENIEKVLGTLAPPPEVVDGMPGQARRASPVTTGWWDVHFFPIRDEEGDPGIVGKISAVPRPFNVTAPLLPEKLAALRQRHVEQYRLDALIGEGPVADRLREQIRLAANTRLPVLLVGPEGTGKHWTARAIHQLSREREGAFACLDCASLPSNAVADILFNIGQGTGLACIYLHAIDCLAHDVQERLCLFLESEKADPALRFIAGVADAEQAIQDGHLAQAPYCRLSALTIALPHFRDRTESLEAWTSYFLARAGEAAERTMQGISPGAMELLGAHTWRRNLDELYETVLGASQHAKGNVIEPTDLPFYLRQSPLPVNRPLALDEILQEVERRLIVQALRLAKNNRSRAAELLTIWRARLLRRMEAFGITDNSGPNDVAVDETPGE